MGPRSDDRGIGEMTERDPRIDPLQWGRDLMIAEFQPQAERRVILA